MTSDEAIELVNNNYDRIKDSKYKEILTDAFENKLCLLAVKVRDNKTDSRKIKESLKDELYDIESEIKKSQKELMYKDKFSILSDITSDTNPIWTQHLGYSEHLDLFKAIYKLAIKLKPEELSELKHLYTFLNKREHRYIILDASMPNGIMHIHTVNDVNIELNTAYNGEMTKIIALFMLNEYKKSEDEDLLSRVISHERRRIKGLTEEQHSTLSRIHSIDEIFMNICSTTLLLKLEFTGRDKSIWPYTQNLFSYINDKLSTFDLGSNTIAKMKLLHTIRYDDMTVMQAVNLSILKTYTSLICKEMG